MKVLVTGGAGFLGGFVVQESLRRGYEVDILDVVEPTKYLFVGNVILEDLSTGHVLSIRADNYDVICHAVGILGVETTFDNVANAVYGNIIATINLLDWGRRTSSDKTPLVVQPGLIPTWRNSYMISKHAAEEYGFMYHEEYGIRYTSVRPMNVYGPRQAWNNNKIGPIFVLRALRNQPIPIYGIGDTLINATYVKDVARLFVDILELGIDGKVIDMPDPNGYMTVKDFAEIVLELTGSTGGIEYLPMRRGEPGGTQVRGDDTCISNLLYSGYRDIYASSFTDIRIGLAETVNWYRSIL